MAAYTISSTEGQAGLNETSPLHDLASAIRRFEKIIRDYQRSALRTSLDLGDVLGWARGRVEVRRWKKWRTENCPEVSKRRDEVCRQLAASRAIIERALADDPDLSIREALKLITTPKEQPAKPKPLILEKWKTLSTEEKRAGLAADGVDALLQSYVPDDWRAKLAEKIAPKTKLGANTDEIAKLARECRALLAHPEQHVDNLREKLSRIVKLTGCEPKKPPAEKCGATLDTTLFARVVSDNTKPSDVSGDERKVTNAAFDIPEDLSIPPDLLRRTHDRARP